MGRFIAIVAFLFSALISPLAAAPAYACSCVSPNPTYHALFADVIVIGTVDSVDMPLPGADGRWSSLDPVSVSVTVERYLRGTGGVDLEFSTARSGASCGALEILDVGKRHLLLLRGDGSNYTTNLCSGNVVLDGSAGVEYLREIEAITGMGVLSVGQTATISAPGAEGER